jgi:hypothetical protein
LAHAFLTGADPPIGGLRAGGIRVTMQPRKGSEGG